MRSSCFLTFDEVGSCLEQVDVALAERLTSAACARSRSVSTSAELASDSNSTRSAYGLYSTSEPYSSTTRKLIEQAPQTVDRGVSSAAGLGRRHAYGQLRQRRRSQGHSLTQRSARVSAAFVCRRHMMTRASPFLVANHRQVVIVVERLFGFFAWRARPIMDFAGSTERLVPPCCLGLRAGFDAGISVQAILFTCEIAMLDRRRVTWRSSDKRPARSLEVSRAVCRNWRAWRWSANLTRRSINDA